MSTPYQYFGHGSQMSADLKRVARRVRARRPKLFDAYIVKDVHTDKECHVTVTERVNVHAVEMDGRTRHRLSLQTDRH